MDVTPSPTFDFKAVLNNRSYTFSGIPGADQAAAKVALIADLQTLIKQLEEQQ